jgi:2,3-bisphosphoglycerate-independent phosphoglycerate mutase
MSILDFLKPKIVLKPGNIKPVVLLVLDGWGIAPPSPGNAITLAKKPNWDNLNLTYPHSELIASGESVGLPANEVGNTEVGHLNMGAGRIVLQDLKRIDKAIEDTTFDDNKAFKDAIVHVKANNSRLHLIGLVSSGNVHSSLAHFYALLNFCEKNSLKNVFLHLFTDGRDAPPNEGIQIIAKIEDRLKTSGIGRIATIAGRYYGMDRDRRWERTQKAYDAMVNGRGVAANSAQEAIQNSYNAGRTDEFVDPTVIDPSGVINNNDAAIFFNFRIDRPRQLTMVLTVTDFTKTKIAWEFDPYEVKYEKKHATDKEAIVAKKEPFDRQRVPQNLFFVTMTQYQKNIPVSAVAFPPAIVVNCLTQVLSNVNLRQMHMSESEKERFVTYYFDGLREEKVLGEDVSITASPHVATYDKKPEMSVFQLTEEIKKVLARDTYHFLVINFANPDMVAHTGNLQATIKAIEFVDLTLGEVVAAVLAVDGTLLITGDHGNAEELLTYESKSFFFTSTTGAVNTDHSNNPVPIIFVNKAWANLKKEVQKGILGDIAPSILAIMRVAQPKEMTGRSLINP